MMRFPFRTALVCSWLGTMGHAAAQTATDEMTDFFSLTLEELSHVRISVVSDREETIREAPAIVSRLERAQMERLGLRTLKDIISFFPGFVVNADPTGISPVMVRGLYDPEDQKILFLLDDTPYWMPATGDIPLLGISVAAIESVEVIRGPGGVIYGTNASAGVIKVVTRQDHKTELDILLGNNDLAITSGFGRFELAQGELTLSAEYRHDHGYQAKASHFIQLPAENEAFQLNFDQNGHIHRAQAHLSGLLKYRNQGFGLTAHAFDSTDTGVTNAFLESPHVRRETGQLLASHFEFDWRSWQYKLYADINRYYYRSDVDDLLTIASVTNHIDPMVVGDGNFEFDNHGDDNYRFKTGFRLSGSVLEQLRLDFGIENELRSSERFSITDDVGGVGYEAIMGVPSLTLYHGGKVRELATYAQFDYKDGPWRVILGARYTGNDDYGDHITPKASLVYQFDPRQSLKLLFSEGFNSPTLAQKRVVDQFSNATFLEAHAETIQSSDLAYTWSDRHHNLVVNIFHLDAIDLIQRATSGGFTNADHMIHREGVELDYKYVDHQWQFFASAHYLEQGDQQIDGDPSAFITPAITASLGVNYQWGAHRFGLSERYVGERAGIGSYHLLNLSYSRQLGQFEWFVDVQNLLDQQAMHNNSKFVNFPMQMASVQGRAVQFGFSYVFD